MKKNLSIVLLATLFSCWANYAFAQAENQDKIDSLRRVLFTQKGEARAHTLFQLGLALTDSDLDQSLSHINSALVMGKQYNDKAFVAKCNLQLAANEFKRGKWANSLSFATEALPFFEQRKDSANLIRLYNTTGNAYNELGLTDLALSYQLKVLEHLHVETESPLALGRAYNNVANLYTQLGETEKAKDFYQNSLDIFKEVNDTVRYITILNNMSAIFSEEEVDIAIDTLEKALSMAEKMGNPDLLSMVYFNIAYQNTRAERPETGWRYLQLSKKAYRESRFRYLPPQFLLEEAAVYRNRKRYDSVEVILRRLLQVANDQQMNQFKLVAYDQLGSLYKTLDNSDSALRYVELANGIRDSLKEAEKENLLAGLKIENEFSQKQSQLDQLTLQRQTIARRAQIRYWASMGLMILIIGALIYYIFRLRSRGK